MIKIKQLVKTCEACPAQWEGYTDDDRKVYVRYRWGHLSVRLGDIGDTAEFAGIRGEEIFGKQIGEDLHGVMSYDELKELTKDIIQWAKLR